MAREIDPTLSRYMTMAQQQPLLSREEELALCTRWAADHDPAVADQLVRAHLRYVVSIALKYRRYGVPLGELIAEGNFGVVHALGKFEPERGLRFVTYAAYWIRAYVLGYIIRSWSLVGGGSGALRSKLFFKLRRERVRVLNLVGEGDEADELLAARLQLPKEQVTDMVRRLEQRDVSLDAKVFDDSGTTLGDTLPASGLNQEQRVMRGEVSELVDSAVREAVSELDERERYIVEKRLMAQGPDELSLAEIGRQLGVSRERARQLEARAKKKLEHRLVALSRASGWDVTDVAA